MSEPTPTPCLRLIEVTLVPGCEPQVVEVPARSVLIHALRESPVRMVRLTFQGSSLEDERRTFAVLAGGQEVWGQYGLHLLAVLAGEDYHPWFLYQLTAPGEVPCLVRRPELGVL